MSTRWKRSLMVKKLSCCVRPGVCEVRASVFRPVSALTRLDFPTLERPAKAISTLLMGGRFLRELAAQMKSASPAKSLRPISMKGSMSWFGGLVSVMGLLSALGRHSSRLPTDFPPGGLGSEPEGIGPGELGGAGRAFVEELFLLPFHAPGRNLGEIQGKGPADGEIVQGAEPLLQILQDAQEPLATLARFIRAKERAEELCAVSQLFDADPQFMTLLVADVPQMLCQLADSLEA